MMKRTLTLILTLSAILTCAGAQNYTQPVIDAHCHFQVIPGEDLFHSPESYFKDNSAYNVKYVFGLTIAQAGEMEVTRLRNDSLFAMAAREPRFIPVCSVHPYDGEEAIAELDRIVEKGGKIIKLHPISQNFDILNENVIKLTRAAGERGLVMLYDGYGFYVPNYVEDLLRLVLANPGTKFIIAHMGGADFHKFAPLFPVKKYNPGMLDNMWVDISATVWIYAGSPFQEQLEWTIRNVGTDRVLFGSDDPAVSLPDALEALYKLNLTPEEQDQILYRNAKELLQLD